MKNAYTSIVLAALLLAAAPAPVTAQAQTYGTTAEDPQVVRFVARHSLGPVDGTLNPVVGALTFDPAAPTEGLTGRFTADVASFDTDLGMRDRDMKKNYLEVDRYPEAVFQLDDARPTMLPATSGDTLHLAVSGSMTLHGVTRQHGVRASLTPTAEGYLVRAAFPLRLTDYAIKPPKRFLLKVNDEIEVEVVLQLVRRP